MNIEDKERAPTVQVIGCLVAIAPPIEPDRKLPYFTSVNLSQD